MTKERAMYYRKKNGGVVIEGREGRKAVLIWTLPPPSKLLPIIISNPSLFTKEKWGKIAEKIKRLDYQSKRPKNTSPKVRLPHIRRTPRKDGTIQITQEQSKDLWEVTK